MKQKIYLIALLFLGMSCKDDFLTEVPKGVLSTDVLFSSEQIQMAADNLPATLGGIWSVSDCVVPFMGGDDITDYPLSSKYAITQIDIFDVHDNNARLQNWWAKSFSTIRSANTILAYVDKNAATETVKNDLKGQAYFYRGISYSFLTRIFGKVPLIDTFNISPDLSLKNAEVADIYALIISDLKKAETLLPNVRPEKPSERGGYPGAKPCKGTAKALLSQVYLTMAGWPLKQVSNYALAAAKAKEVMDNATTYGYKILSDPKDLWTWANNYTNQEIIFGFYYNFNLGQLNMHNPLGPRPAEYVNPTASWATGWSDYYGEVSFFKRFPEGPRKDATYQTIINVPGVGDVQWDDSRTYTRHPYIKKYQEDFPGAIWAGSRTAQVIRYAEVLLNYAEAQAMAEGAPNANAYQAINTIRNRAGLPDLTPGLSAEAFRDAVIAERGWEFAGGEAASRWFDLIRTETLEKATLLRDPSEGSLRNIPTLANYWMPIPAGEVSVNPNLANQ